MLGGSSNISNRYAMSAMIVLQFLFCYLTSCYLMYVFLSLEAVFVNVWLQFYFPIYGYYIQLAHINLLVHGICNSISNAWSYVFLAISHQYRCLNSFLGIVSHEIIDFLLYWYNGSLYISFISQNLKKTCYAYIYMLFKLQHYKDLQIHKKWM